VGHFLAASVVDQGQTAEAGLILGLHSSDCANSQKESHPGRRLSLQLDQARG